MRLSEYIKNFRSESSMTQEDFAKLANLSRGYVSQIENELSPQTGKAPIPSLETLNGIARATGKTVDELLGEIDDIKISLSSSPARVDELRAIASKLTSEDQETLLVLARSLENRHKR